MRKLVYGQARLERQITFGVVARPLVFVVHLLPSLELPLQLARHDHTVFVRVSAAVGERVTLADPQKHIAMRSDGSSALPVGASAGVLAYAFGHRPIRSVLSCS